MLKELHTLLLKKSIIIILLVLIIDQAVKIWVKTHMILGEEIPVFGNWFIIHFTENEGMAFGMKFGGDFGKLFLSLFRIVAVSIIGWYILHLIKLKSKTSLILCMSLVFAGAAGNIIDSAFYGMIFNESYFNKATMFPPGGGYAGFLYGKVVDMFYFPIIEGTYPQWFPFLGGDHFQFFRPVFNVSDSAISVGVFWLIFFQSRLFPKDKKEAATSDQEETSND